MGGRGRPGDTTQEAAARNVTSPTAHSRCSLSLVVYSWHSMLTNAAHARHVAGEAGGDLSADKSTTSPLTYVVADVGCV